MPYKKIAGFRSIWERSVGPLGALVLALLLGAILIQLIGLNSVAAYSAMVQGAFGSKSALGETIIKMVPLIFTGLSFALANRCGLINIGAEGQLYVGGLAAVAVALYVPGLPIYLHLPLAVIAGFIGGGIWGMLAGVLKVRFGANEMITTIMLNYIGNYLINYMVAIAMIDPVDNLQQTARMPATAQLPIIVSGTRVHLGIIIALLCIVLYYVFLWKMKSGFQTRVVGLNPEAARYAGINDKQKTILAMFMAGGFAGLAGMAEILGVQMRMYQNFSPGYGFDGIAVALLGQSSPVGILLSSLLFGALRSGSNLMQMMEQVPAAMIYIIQSLVLMFVVGSQLIPMLQKKRDIKRNAKGDQ